MSPVPGFIGSCPTSSRVRVYLLRWDMTGRLREGQPIKVRVIPAPPKNSTTDFGWLLKRKFMNMKVRGIYHPIRDAGQLLRISVCSDKKFLYNPKCLKGWHPCLIASGSRSSQIMKFLELHGQTVVKGSYRSSLKSEQPNDPTTSWTVTERTSEVTRTNNTYIPYIRLYTTR